jgi:hypothetical protein
MGIPFQSLPSLTVGFGKEGGGWHLISEVFILVLGLAILTLSSVS